MSCPLIYDPETAAAAIRRGQLVALPTETVYGLGADATNPTAVARIFEAKQRPFFDPLIVHVPDLAAVSSVASPLTPLEQTFAERFWPGPLTLVLPKQDHIPDLVTSGLHTIGVRVPRHPLMQQVLTRAGCPIAAPSANPFGRLSPTTAEHVRQQLGDRIDLILDGGPCAVGLESTILRIDGDCAIVLRVGGLAIDDIRAVAPQVRVASGEIPTAPEAPGMLPQHYAPRTPIVVCTDDLPVPPASARWGLLSLRPQTATGYVAVRSLSESGDLVTAAARFFETLHALDALGLDRIVAIPFPDQGLGIALNDRLQRASAT